MLYFKLIVYNAFLFLLLSFITYFQGLVYTIPVAFRIRCMHEYTYNSCIRYVYKYEYIMLLQSAKIIENLESFKAYFNIKHFQW